MVVFCGFFLFDFVEFEDLWDLMVKLCLNDVSFEYEMEISVVFGFGFCCGFLGFLYLEIVWEWIECEFNIDFIIIVFSVIYYVYMINGDMVELYNLVDMFDLVYIECIEELWIEVFILVFDEYLGGVLKLCEDCWGI